MLRIELIHNGGPGLDHVEALLAIRGHNLGPVPRKSRRVFKRGKLRLAIYAALRDGPMTGQAIVRHVTSAHGLAYEGHRASIASCPGCGRTGV